MTPGVTADQAPDVVGAGVVVDEVELVVEVVLEELVVVVDVEVVEVVAGTVEEVVVDDVDVVVVVAFGITNPFAHPHRMSIGAPTGVPTAEGIASKALRTWAQPSHAETPVVGHPAFTCEQAAVWTVIAASRSGFAIATPRAASTAHWRA